MRLPKSFNDITIFQYQVCYNLLKKDHSIETWVAVLAALSNKSYAEIEAIPIWQLKKHIEQLAFIMVPPTKLKVKKYIYVNGRIYKAIYKANHLTPGQGIDIKTFLKPQEGQTQEDSAVSNAHHLLACIYLPLKRLRFSYDGIDHEEIANDFLKCKCGDVLGTLFFYSKTWERLINASVKSGNESLQILTEHMEEVMKWRTASGITGVGN